MLPTRTRRWAHALKWLCWLVMLGVIGAAIYLSAAPQQVVASAYEGLSRQPDAWQVGTLAVACLYALYAVQLAIGLFILWHMARLFDSYARGQALDGCAARHLRGVGLGTVAKALAGLLWTPLASLALSIDAPVGQRMLAVALDNQTIALALSGGLMLMIGMVMAQAVEIAQENASFV